MINGIPNRPLYFYQKDILAGKPWLLACIDCGGSGVGLDGFSDIFESLE